MPRGDGTGPFGLWRGCGQASGRSGRGQTMAMEGRGRGMGRAAAGPATECLCPKCGTKAPHQAGTPCFQQKCPQCGASMVQA